MDRYLYLVFIHVYDHYERNDSPNDLLDSITFDYDSAKKRCEEISNGIQVPYYVHCYLDLLESGSDAVGGYVIKVDLKTPESSDRSLGSIFYLLDQENLSLPDPCFEYYRFGPR